MGSRRGAGHPDAARVVRPRGRARGRGDDDARDLPVGDGRSPGVVLYHAAGCHLCERARATLESLRGELGFELREVDIGGDADLEARYREFLPVVEIDGERAFVYFVPEDGFRRRISRTN